MTVQHMSDCGIPELADNTVPVSNPAHNIGARIRIQCAEGYVRKAGTSNLIRCTQQQNGNASWHSDLPLKCIRVNASVRTSNNSEEGKTVAVFSNDYTSAIGGVTGIILLCLVAAVFTSLWLRHRNNRNQIVYHPKPDPYTSYIPVSVRASEHSSAQSNKAAENSTEVSVIDENPGIPHGSDTCDKLLPQTDS
ncbi:hypothetical protein G5714_024754 [Onychostoma macrolepis]|uniref:Sushi domain-containing protein n=1 Tax=Onychostoma macrolepis TaxID=369639 RepID=A0A7J6BI54_9TELE|nr:hypothetical protein G5714_024754 [Onychostoma macrolepis]